MSRPDPGAPARTGSPGRIQAEAWREWTLAAALAGLVLLRFAGWSRPAGADGSCRVAVAFQGRGFEVPAERPQLAGAIQAAGPAAGVRASCLRLQGGTEVSGGAACLSNSARYALGLPLDLNRARLPELERVPGLGRKRAEEILQERIRRGGFRSLEECLNLAAVPAAARPALAREFVVEASQASDADSARKNR
jgi:hypothetical protein